MIFNENRPFCVFEAPFGGLRGNVLAEYLFSEKFRQHLWILQPRNPIIYVEIGTILRTELKSVHFLVFLCKFGCYGNSLCSPKIFISIFEFSDPENLNINANIVSIAFNWTEICGILVYSCIILVAMATPLALSKIQVAYLNSTTP